MKRHKIIKRMTLFLAAFMLLVLASCKFMPPFSETPSPSPSASTSQDIATSSTSPSHFPSDKQVTESSPSTEPWTEAYINVLQNAATFFSTDSNSNLSIDQLNQSISDDSSVTVKATKFAVVDLDNGGAPEVILWLNVNNDDYYGFEVLRYHDGVIYGYTLWYRAFMELKVDGTFSFSSGAADNGFGTVRFTENIYIFDGITYCRPDESNDNQKIAYFVNNRENATEDEFQSAIDKQSEKTDVTWYDFTGVNIETVLTH